MPDVNAQMVMRLHQMTGEPITNCQYLLGQTNGDYELALKILHRILVQRKAENDGPDTDQQMAEPGTEEVADIAGDFAQPELQVLEARVQQLEIRFAQLADTLDTLSGKLTQLLDKLSDPDPDLGPGSS